MFPPLRYGCRRACGSRTSPWEICAQAGTVSWATAHQWSSLPVTMLAILPLEDSLYVSGTSLGCGSCWVTRFCPVMSLYWACLVDWFHVFQQPPLSWHVIGPDSIASYSSAGPELPAPVVHQTTRPQSLVRKQGQDPIRARDISCGLWKSKSTLLQELQGQYSPFLQMPSLRTQGLDMQVELIQ